MIRKSFTFRCEICGAKSYDIESEEEAIKQADAHLKLAHTDIALFNKYWENAEHRATLCETEEDEKAIAYAAFSAGLRCGGLIQ